MNTKQSENQLFFNWIDDLELKTQLTNHVIRAKNKRKGTQKDISKELNISLTKFKEIENGKCKDFNAINNYINYYQEPMKFEYYKG